MLKIKFLQIKKYLLSETGASLVSFLALPWRHYAQTGPLINLVSGAEIAQSV
jgi:hypothetical protein